jgi:predicted ATPase
MRITLKNYRCFSDLAPARISLSDGITAFVGVNNAGKSTLLRFFYELRSIFTILGSDMNTIMRADGGAEAGFQVPPEIADPEELFYNGNADDMEIGIELGEVDQVPLPHVVVTEAVITLTRKGSNWKVKFRKSGKDIRDGASGTMSWVGKSLRDGSSVVADFQPLMEACSVIAEACYIPSFRHVSHFSPADGPRTYYDMNVGRPFIDSWKEMQTGNLRASRERIHRLVEEIRSIFGFRELQINTSINGQALQLMIDGKPFNLQDLGAGLAQFILALGTAAFRRPTYILIDEPELSLHPSLQVTFVMKVAAYASRGLLFATHNVGLARSVAEEIYSVQKGQDGTRVAPIDRTPELAELLGELNYEGYRSLGFQKLLLVEGRTDVKTFIEFLRLLNRDNEFLVVPIPDFINGNSQHELQEVTRICPEVFAVIDSEKTNPDAEVSVRRQEFTASCLRVGIECHVLERKATENYLPERAVRDEFGPLYRALGPFEDRTGGNWWPKPSNWKIARRMEREELEATDLGQFLIRI